MVKEASKFKESFKVRFSTKYLSSKCPGVNSNSSELFCEGTEITHLTLSGSGLALKLKVMVTFSPKFPLTVWFCSICGLNLTSNSKVVLWLYKILFSLSWIKASHRTFLPWSSILGLIQTSWTVPKIPFSFWTCSTVSLIIVGTGLSKSKFKLGPGLPPLILQRILPSWPSTKSSSISISIWSTSLAIVTLILEFCKSSSNLAAHWQLYSSVTL